MLVIYPKLKRAERYPLHDQAAGPWKDTLALLEAGIELCNEPALALLFGEAVDVVFQAANRYLGVAVGEHLGYALTGAWTLLAGVALTQSSAVPGVLGFAGVVVGPVLALLGSACAPALRIAIPSTPETIEADLHTLESNLHRFWSSRGFVLRSHQRKGKQAFELWLETKKNNDEKSLARVDTPGDPSDSRTASKNGR
jgi:hypothetical protein